MNRIRRLLQAALGLVVLSTMLVLLAVACGGETADETAGETTAAERTTTEGQVALYDLPKAPPAPRDAVDPRLRGSQDMAPEEIARAVVTIADDFWQGFIEEAGVTYLYVDFYAYEQSVEVC